MIAAHGPLALAIDVGSGSCRALVFDASGSLVGLSQREWNYHPVDGWPGGFDFDTNAGWENVQACIREVTGRTGINAAHIAQSLPAVCARGSSFTTRGVKQSGHVPTLTPVRDEKPRK